MLGLLVQLVSGLASPLIFLPSLAIGWFVRRWWQVVLGATIVGMLSEAEILLIELPGSTPDWTQAPLGFVAPVAWCAAGFIARAWQRRTSHRRQGGPMRAWPVVAGMALGAFVVGALALGTGLLYLQTGQLEFHTLQFGP